MKPEDRRRFGAVAGLAVGLFLGLALVPGIPTGPVGRGLGDFLWSGLGVGALGLPLLGLGLGLAGFERIPRLDMKRAAILLGGLAVLVPFTIGVIANVGATAFDPPLAEWAVVPRLVGLFPGLLSRVVVQLIGQPGGIILGFVLLTGVTLASLAWHPLARLEKKSSLADKVALQPRPADVDDEFDSMEEGEESPRLPARRGTSKPPARPKLSLLGGGGGRPPVGRVTAADRSPQVGPAPGYGGRQRPARPPGAAVARDPADVQGRWVHRGTDQRTGGDPVRDRPSPRRESGSDHGAGG